MCVSVLASVRVDVCVLCVSCCLCVCNVGRCVCDVICEWALLQGEGDGRVREMEG